MTAPRFPWPMGDKRRGGPLLGPGGPPKLFSWNPELAEPLPAPATFTRSGTAYYRNNSGIWAQLADGIIRDQHNTDLGGGNAGYLAEPGSTNYALHSRDLTQASRWTATNITPTKDATGIDGIANAASTLTADANNGTILQSSTRLSADFVFTCFVARVTGTGTVEMTINGGSAWVDITSNLTLSLDNPQTVAATLATPSFGFRLGTSGDQIEVDMAQLEENLLGSRVLGTTPIPSVGVAASRSGEVVNIPGILVEPYSWLVDLTYPGALGPSGSNDSGILTFGAGGSDRLTAYENGASTRRQLFTTGAPGTNILLDSSDVAGTREKIAGSFSTAESALAATGLISPAPDTSPGTIRTGNLKLGEGNFRPFRGVVHNFELYSVAQTVEQLESLVA